MFVGTFVLLVEDGQIGKFDFLFVIKLQVALIQFIIFFSPLERKTWPSVYPTELSIPAASLN